MSRTIPFDGSEDVLVAAAQTKIDKYVYCGLLLVRPFVVGALGSWFTGNEQCLSDLGIQRNSRLLLRRQCVSDAISGSETVWSLFRNRESGPAVILVAGEGLTPAL